MPFRVFRRLFVRLQICDLWLARRHCWLPHDSGTRKKMMMHCDDAVAGESLITHDVAMMKSKMLRKI